MKHHDDHGIIGPPRDQTKGLGLFDSVTAAQAERALDQTFVHPEPPPRARDENAALTGISNAEREAAIERIKREVRQPLIDLALARKDALEKDRIGVTAADARELAERRGLGHLVGDQQRAWSWLSPWLAELCRTQSLIKYRVHDMPMKRMSDHGNENVIYLHPYDHRARGAA